MPHRAHEQISRHGARLLALLVVGVISGGMTCEDEHVGRPCELGTTPMGGSTGQIATLSSPALECPSRICLLPRSDTGNPQGTGPLCTAACETSEDCADGETGPKNDPNDGRCENGFVCMWPTTVSAFRCQKLCVCRDFVHEPTSGFEKPPECR
jgi:hypothetical protein